MIYPTSYKVSVKTKAFVSCTFTTWLLVKAASYIVLFLARAKS